MTFASTFPLHAASATSSSLLLATLFGLPFPCLSSSGFWYLVRGGFDVASSSICSGFDGKI
jgi:hypothetical protein